MSTDFLKEELDKLQNAPKGKEVGLFLQYCDKVIEAKQEEKITREDATYNITA